MGKRQENRRGISRENRSGRAEGVDIAAADVIMD